MKTLKALALLTLAAGLAAAQPGTFTGEHTTGVYPDLHCNPTVYPNSPIDGENNCSYVAQPGQLQGDICAATAYVTDQTYLNFPWQGPSRTPPPTYLPSAPLISTNWTGTIPWNSGCGVTGETTIVGGSCSTVGGPVGSAATYTVTCMGTDTNGNPASKSHTYHSSFVGGRGGAFWQPISDGTGTVTFQTYVPAAPAAPIIGGPSCTPDE